MMKSNVEVLDKGISILLANMGVIETEHFVSVIQQEKFDYTKWQREYFDGMDPEQFLAEAAAYEEDHPFVGKRLV